MIYIIPRVHHNIIIVIAHNKVKLILISYQFTKTHIQNSYPNPNVCSLVLGTFV